MPNWKKLIVSGSDASLTNLTVNNAVTASYFVGDGSALTNISVDVSEVATVSDTFTSTTFKTVTHNFDTKDVIVTVYNSSDQQIIPSTVTTTDINNVEVTFDVSTSGRIIVAKGGHIVSGSAEKLDGQDGVYYLDYTNFTNIPSGIISGSNQISELTRFEQDITGSSTYNITHNLNEDYPIVQIYDTNKEQVIPGIISSSNANIVYLEFDNTFAGKVVIKK